MSQPPRLGEALRTLTPGVGPCLLLLGPTTADVDAVIAWCPPETDGFCLIETADAAAQASAALARAGVSHLHVITGDIVLRTAKVAGPFDLILWCAPGPLPTSLAARLQSKLRANGRLLAVRSEACVEVADVR